MSQTATMSLPGASSSMSLQPLPPTPTQARASLRCGEAAERKAGAAEAPNRAAPDCFKKERRSKEVMGQDGVGPRLRQGPLPVGYTPDQAQRAPIEATPS